MCALAYALEPTITHSSQAIVSRYCLAVLRQFLKIAGTHVFTYLPALTSHLSPSTCPGLRWSPGDSVCHEDGRTRDRVARLHSQPTATLCRGSRSEGGHLHVHFVQRQSF